MSPTRPRWREDDQADDEATEAAAQALLRELDATTTIDPALVEGGAEAEA